MYTSPNTYTVTVSFAKTSQPVYQGSVVVAAPEVTPPVTPVPEPAPEPVSGVQQWESDMLNQVNAVRAGVGAPPLTLCSPLTRAAQKHSEDMASRDYFSHVSPDGTGPGNRINGEGYRGGWGENIAAGYNDVSAVMNGWINSPGHYANLINPAYTHVGFGKASGGGYGIYWTQNFGYRGDCG